MKIIEMKRTDVLVVGAGLSGIKACYELISKGVNVLLTTKTTIASGSSFFPLKASLGTQVTKDDFDKKVFLKDIEDVSHGMNDAELSRIYVEEISDHVKEYKDIGIHAEKLKGTRKACFANHERDIYLLKDWDEIRKNVRSIFNQFPNLQVLEQSNVISIVKKEGSVVGAFLLDKENEYIFVQCKAVILATGGFGNIYKHNLNPNDVDGSGHILAYEAGAKLVNMEFIQFIPGFTSPQYKTLFGEHTLSYCTDIVDKSGNSILDEFFPEGVDKREILDLRSTHGPFTTSLKSSYIDIALMKKILDEQNEEGYTLRYQQEIYENKEEFYTVYLNWLKEKGIDLVRDEVKIAPFAHASNGGVVIDVNGQTGVKGLFAIGELSAGVEGANRLGGNSTGSCMVFGKRTAETCYAYVQSKQHLEVNVGKEFINLQENWDNGEHNITPNEVIKEIREIMWYYANVIRNEDRLTFAINKINQLKRRFSVKESMKNRSLRKGTIKARNYLLLSGILLHAMKERKESRGAHYREDYPLEDHRFNKKLYIYKCKTKTSYQFIDTSKI